MNESIEITVIGRAGDGKSSVVTLIAQALSECGFAVDVRIPACNQIAINGAFLRQLADRLHREGDSIVIHEVTGARASTG